ncbi:MAG: CheY-like chemotaxis protein, partial [Gammaproteobacteria bacterium]
VMASGPVEASITHQLTNQTIKPEGQVDTDEEISVLIFKGDPVLGRSVIEVISSDRIKVDMVEIADNAFELLQDEKIDCLIIDLEFKGSMDGFEFLEKIHQKNLTIPHTIIYTGKDLTTSEESRLKKLAVSILITGSGAPEKLLAEMMRFAGIEDKDLSVYQSEIIQKISLAKDIFENKTILLVDDDTRNLFALSSALEQYDMKVVMAKNGRECIEELNSNDTIDLVLMDIMMPEMDGFEAMEILRRDSRFKTLPIIALTAKAMKGDMEKCLKAGASDYLGKPVQVDSLLSLIEDWLTK